VTLTQDHLTQLRAVADAGLLWPGDTLSHGLAEDLAELRLIARIEGWWAITSEGLKVLAKEAS